MGESDARRRGGASANKKKAKQSKKHYSGASASKNKKRRSIDDAKNYSAKETHERYKLTTPVFFVGFMGAGKTTLTRKLALMYGLASLDMDIYIEKQERYRVREIFREFGEEKFREAEARVLAELSEKKPLLISCGGGIITNKKSREILKKNYVVFMNTTAEQSKSRISNFRSRPLFKKMDEANKLNQERLPLYRSVANVEIDTRDKNSSIMAREVAGVLLRNGVLVRV